MSLRPIKIPEIRALSTKTPTDVRGAIEDIRGFLRQLRGRGGVVAAQDMVDAGMLSSSGQALVPVVDLPPPLIVENFTATGAFRTIQLAWDAARYAVLYEVYRNTADVLGTAVKIGTTTATIVTDTPAQASLSVTYYYWVRAVNGNGQPGPYNSTVGTAASTADDPEYLLQIATEKWKPSYNYALADLSLPTKPNGYVYEVTVDGGSSGATEPVWPVVIDTTVADGGLTWKCKAAFSFETYFKIAYVDGVPHLALKELFLADGIISRAKIADLAVDAAKIADAAIGTAKIGDLQVTSLKVADAAITSAKIGDAQITNAKIGALAVNTANINDAAITTAKIGDLQVSSLKIGNNAVTVPVSAYTSGSISFDEVLTTIQSAVITTHGQPVQIIVSQQTFPGDDGDGFRVSYSLHLYRDSTLLWSAVDSEEVNYGNTFAFSDTPTAGTYAYYVKMQAAHDGLVSNAFATNRSLLLLEVQK